MQFGGVLSTSQVANSFMGTGLMLPPIRPPIGFMLPGVVEPAPITAEEGGGYPPPPPDAVPPPPAEGRNPLTALAIFDL